MARFIDGLCKVLEGIIALALAAMVVLVFGNVVLRYGFNSGITVSEEISRWLFIWATFLGAVVALRERGHLGVDMVVNRLPVWGKRACLIVGHALMLFIVVLLFLGSLEQTQINWDVTAPTTGWSMAWVAGASLVFSTLAAGLLLLDLVRALAGRLREDELVMVQESEEATQMRQVLADARAGKEVVR
jgi:TRAP-type C4-dicarboxylate transport system permease small subunit